MLTALQIRSPLAACARVLSIAVVSPDEQRRHAATIALGECQGVRIREFLSYPAGMEGASQMLGDDFDAVLVDLDTNPKFALELVESICMGGMTTAIVYSSKSAPDLLLRSMRAGAREYLILPLHPGEMAEAVVRASALRSVVSSPKMTSGRLLVFLGAKGGSGVTTLACNYAVALAQESKQKTLLIDLNLPMGDAAINLGIHAEYSTVNALENFSRLDSNFLAGLLQQHSSGLFVLSAPTELASTQTMDDAVDRLLEVACQEFDYVVVDAGSRLDLQHTRLFDESSSLYLVTQIGIPELRNSNRLISKLSLEGNPKFEVVINRYDPRSMEIDEAHLTKALTRPADWKIPNNYAAVRRMQNTATPLTEEDTQIARAIRQMTRPVSGQPATPKSRKGFRLFG